MTLLLKDAYPEFAEELANLLNDEPDLAASVNELELVDRCRCDDKSCASFYTVSPPPGPWGPGHENVLDSDKGMIVLDLIDRRIGMVEVINREDIRNRILKLIP